MRFKKLFIIMALLLFTCNAAFSADAWINDLRNLFLSNNAVIYGINLRTFNAKDDNGNGIIDGDEESGNFVNAVERLDNLAMMGVNTIHILPITPVGKIKALGTAGSLYAASSFTELNPQLKSKKNTLSIEEQARKFVDECHRRRIRVIVDLPSCGSYDLYLKSPELFKKDKNGNGIVPADWTDVRLLDGENPDVYNQFKGFVDLMLSLDVDGIRADVATIKPYTFWKDLINYTRKQNPQFLFLAEASDSWKEPPAKESVFTTYDKLLDAGFDGYYGSYFNLKDWKTSKDLISHVKFNLALAKKYTQPKTTIGSFATHDELSPILNNGEQLSKMIIWLNTTLPLNAYYIDGFATGDNYIYFWANKKAQKTYTDDDYYFVHRGKLDIFNFSRRPGGNNTKILQEFVLANKFKIYSNDIISNGNFVSLSTNSPSVFAYTRSSNRMTLLVVGNLDFKKTIAAKVNVPKLRQEMISVPIKLDSIPKISNGKFSTELKPGEIQVMLINNFEVK